MTRTMEQVLAEEEARRIEWERTTTHNGYTLAELRQAFDAVKDAENWKNPIRALVNVERLAITAEAIAFHAGCPTRILSRVGDDILIDAVGYYAAVGA